MSPAEQLLEAARAQSARIAVAESCTGGLLGGAITAPAGASGILDRGYITYSNVSKVTVLGVSEQTLLAHGAVSEEVAREMATGTLRRSEADIAISVTGIAGPGGSQHKPEGRVCFGLARIGESTLGQTVEFGAIGREAVRLAAVDHALAMLIRVLTD
ncbi:CinA family protein [Roseicyclus sp. F158]|uniref:CinA family protein n=1 Tax=Tropicimonas omnivorans TaxID=3075590 RepID=A0ABU3DJY2_9RHOB|nr:CinA family protein [Roseicyclus sp. F158]MDT0683976.1 CinA family protein [Roseicyclus sp. F158]